jgi:glutaconate CoA-transferase subunit A
LDRVRTGAPTIGHPVRIERYVVPDKRVTIDEIAAEVHDGMTVGIGGWGSRRKPMALVRALCRSSAKDLRIVSYGGPDVGLLCRAGKVREIVYAFVSLDSIALEPHFRSARQSGSVTTMELDEGMFLLGLQAAAWRVPFLPTRVGLGSDVLRLSPSLRTIRSPYADAEELVAMPALHLDVALIHMHRGDQGGTGQYLNVDPYFDDLMCMAATRRFMSVEKIVETEQFLAAGPAQSIRINRLMVDGVVETPNGAHFTECVPDYPRDEAFQRAYTASAKSDEAWDEFRARYIDVTEAEYQEAVQG